MQDAYDELMHARCRPSVGQHDVRDLARQIDELRVSLWAQQLGTPRREPYATAPDRPRCGAGQKVRYERAKNRCVIETEPLR